MSKQHKLGCMANMVCVVIHEDGVCPGPYGKCTCGVDGPRKGNNLTHPEHQLPPEDWKNDVLKKEGLTEYVIKQEEGGGGLVLGKKILLGRDATPAMFLHEVAHIKTGHKHDGLWGDELTRLYNLYLADGLISTALSERDGEWSNVAEMLWVVLANVSGGDWTKQTKEWQEAAAKWRDSYFALLEPKGPKEINK